MTDHKPTIENDPDQDGESLDADLLPEEFPDRPLAARAFGTTEAEMERGESLRRKLAREEPDINGDGDGPDPDADDGDSPDMLSRLDEDGGSSTDELVAMRALDDSYYVDDSGQFRGPRSAEDDAVHVVDRDRDLEPVWVSRLELGDAEAFLASVSASAHLHHPWVSPPSDIEGFKDLLARDRAIAYAIRTEEGLAGVVNASEIVEGSFHNCYLGFYAFEGFAGRGLMTAGLRLVLADLFDKVGLHRVEANVQPGNERSVRLVERLGFRREGYSRDYLFIDGAWRDHERWALLANDPR